MEDLISDDFFVDVLSTHLSDKALQQLFSTHGDINLSNSSNKSKELKIKEDIVIKFDSRTELLRTLVIIQRRCNEIKKAYTPIHNLSDDCLAQIFSYLSLADRPNVEKVCKRWKKVSQKGWFDVKSLNMCYYFRLYKNVDLIFERCGRFIRHLKFFVDANVDCTELMKKFCRWEEMKTLAIGNYRSTLLERNVAKNLAEIFRKCKKLTSIELELNFKDYAVDYLNELPETMSSIKIYDYSSCQTNTNVSIDVEKFSNLRQLDLSYFSMGENTLKGFRNLKSLERLRFEDCDIPRSYVLSIQGFTNLKELTLVDGRSFIDNSDVSAIAKNCRQIKQLYLTGLPQLTSNCLKDIGLMPSLESLHLEEIDHVIDSNVMFLKNLKKLTYDACFEVKEEHLLISIQQLSNLVEMNIDYCALREEFLISVNRIFTSGQRKLPLNLAITTSALQDDESEWQIPEDLSSLLTLKIKYE